MKAIRIERTGGPDVMHLVDVAPPAPGPGEVLVRHHAIGVNFIDTYHRTGLYPLPLPAGLGLEAAGTVEAVGANVTRFAPGDHIGYCSGPPGAYAELHVVKAERAVKVPPEIDLQIAAASMLKGMTARYLIRKIHPAGPGTTAVVHAAAGGVGQIAVQWASSLGATVIGVVGSDAKAELAKKLGAKHTIVSTREDIAKRVRELTGGAGADVVYDAVGKDTFIASLDSLKPLGMMVSYGNASGPVEPFSPLLLSQKGSLFLTRPTLNHYTATTAQLDETAADLFDVLLRGVVKVTTPSRYALGEAARAHRDLESRNTTGSLVLVP
ncbi:MAG: quinone oxidoreductase [Myxococcaceae bacterium]|nr:quinone oxidoreductase [Myxococcaceae bacterium]